MNNKNDIDFLRDLRSDIDSFLFLGHAPSLGTPGHDSDVTKMKEAMLDPKFQELRRRINEAKPRAMKLIAKFNTTAVCVQYPPSATGGPVIEQHLLDVVTENITWRQMSKARILDMIDQTIGALQLEKKTAGGSCLELDDKLPILKSSYLNNNLQCMIDETVKQGSPISFIMIDIDHFKKFNEDHGHLIGDDVLRATSVQIARVVGNKGKVVRFGGEEMSVILPNYDFEESRVLAERIRKTIEEYVFTVKDKETARITISLGVSCSLEKIGHKILIDEADKALHCSKVKGRNQVNVFDKQICSLNNELIIIDSLKDKDAKEFARLAVDAFRKEDIEEFVKNIKLAFDCAFQTWKEKYTIRMGVAIRGITIPELKKIIS